MPRRLVSTTSVRWTEGGGPGDHEDEPRRGDGGHRRHDRVEIDRADFTLGEDVEARYRSLWDELTEELVITREESYDSANGSAVSTNSGSVNDVDLTPTEEGSLVR